MSNIIVENIINGVRMELPAHLATHPSFAKNFVEVRSAKPKKVFPKPAPKDKVETEQSKSDQPETPIEETN